VRYELREDALCVVTARVMEGCSRRIVTVNAGVIADGVPDAERFFGLPTDRRCVPSAARPRHVQQDSLIHPSLGDVMFLPSLRRVGSSGNTYRHLPTFRRVGAKCTHSVGAAIQTHRPQKLTIQTHSKQASTCLSVTWSCFPDPFHLTNSSSKLTVQKLVVQTQLSLSLGGRMRRTTPPGGLGR
jgi:hypothetical protein